jgi:hypothetical protein
VVSQAVVHHGASSDALSVLGSATFAAGQNLRASGRTLTALMYSSSSACSADTAGGAPQHSFTVSSCSAYPNEIADRACATATGLSGYAALRLRIDVNTSDVVNRLVGGCIGVQVVAEGDNDGDGYTGTSQGGTDCDDNDAAIHPGAPETLCNGIDENCTGASDDHPDADADGYDLCASNVSGADSRAADCDDTRSTTNPGAPETCNGLDDDCDGLVDSADGSLTDAITFSTATRTATPTATPRPRPAHATSPPATSPIGWTVMTPTPPSTPALRIGRTARTTTATARSTKTSRLRPPCPSRTLPTSTRCRGRSFR